MEIKIKAFGKFVLGHYIKSSDAKNVREFSEEQITDEAPEYYRYWED